jgi:hypothetical protein
MKEKVIKDITLKRSSADWQRNVPGKKKNIWIHISKNFVYLSWPENRAYWVFDNMIRAGVTLPKIKFSDRTNTMWISSFGVRFDKAKRL